MKAQWQNTLFSSKSRWRFWAALAGGGSYILLSGSGTFPGFVCSYFSFLPLFLALWKFGEEGFLIAGATALGLFVLAGSFAEMVSYTLFYLLPIFLLERLVGGYVFRLLPLSKKGTRSSPSKERAPAIALLSKNSLEVTLGYFFSGLGICAVLFLMPILSTISGNVLENSALEGILDKLPEGSIRESFAHFLPYFPSFFGVSWGVILFGNFLLARLCLKLMGEKSLFKFSDAGWSVFSWQYGVLALVMLGALLSTSEVSLLARNLIPFAVFPFLVEGMIIAFKVYQRFIGVNRGVWIFLGGLVFLGWPLLIVVILGVFEPWSDLRSRLNLHHKGES